MRMLMYDGKEVFCIVSDPPLCAFFHQDTFFMIYVLLQYNIITDFR